MQASMNSVALLLAQCLLANVRTKNATSRDDEFSLANSPYAASNKASAQLLLPSYQAN